MHIINSKDILSGFDKQMYDAKPLFITSSKFWDGGIHADSTLQEKADFYAVANIMSSIVKELILALGETAYIGKKLCENHVIFADWSDLEKSELYCELSQIIKKKYYKLVLPEDAWVIDLVVEANFKYLSHISLYLADADLILQPTCHTEILVYSKSHNEIIETIKPIVTKFNCTKYEIMVK